MKVLMRKKALAALAAVGFALVGVQGASAVEAPEPAPAPSAPGATEVVNIPVRFTVQNINRSVVACQTDGKTYEVAGHLTAPASALGTGGGAVTLYNHGIAGGEWYWKLDVPGYNHAEEMAKRGHTSVTIDRIGYDASGIPNGYETCIGAQADITHQIIEQLRNGRYEMENTAEAARIGRTPRFDKVASAGQSNGGIVVQIEAYSFKDVDGLSVHAWGDLGFTPEADERLWAATAKCVTGAAPGAPAGELPYGYVYYDQGSEEFRSGNFADAEPQVLDAATPLQNAHPCGDMSSITPAVYTDLQRIDEIDVPVQLIYGENDARIVDIDRQAALYSGSPEVSKVVVPKAGHYVGLDRNAHQVHDSMAAWLNASGIN